MLITKPDPDFQKFHPGLDLLRGIAILLVILYHYFNLAIGWIGVDLFFVLSGFLITKSLVNLQNDPRKYKSFFTNRVLRIFPLYFAALIAFYVAVLLFAKQSDNFSFYLQHWPFYFTFIENWLFIWKGIPAEAHLNHLWSIAVEEQFYVVWPVIVFTFIKKSILPKLLVAIFLLVLISRTIYYLAIFEWNEEEIIFNPFFRADGFVAGALLNFLSFKKRKDIILAFCLLLTICFGGFLFARTMQQENSFVLTLGYSAIALFFASCINLILFYESDKFYSILPIRTLTKLGKISFGVYIFHWPILQFLYLKISGYFNSIIHYAELSEILSTFVCLLITLTLSILSYRYFEKPFLKRKYHPALIAT